MRLTRTSEAAPTGASVTCPRILVAVTLAGAVLAAGCASRGDDPAAPSGPTPRLQLASSLRQLDSCDALREWAADELAPRVGAYGLSGGPGATALADDAVTTERSAAAESGEPLAGAGAGAGADASAGAPATSAAPQAPADEAASSPTHSGTNVQVEGVDEADVVKTDGDRVLALAEGRLHLVSAGTTELIDSLDLPGDLYDAEMLVDGERALVFGTGPGVWTTSPVTDSVDGGRSIVPTDPPATTVVQVDITDDGLAVSGTYALDGTYVSARMVDGVARLVVHADPQQRLGFVTPAAPTEEAEQRAVELNRQVVEEAGPDELLPHWRPLGPDGQASGDGDTLVPCEAAHVPNTFSGFGMVTVVTIDLSRDLAEALAGQPATGVMAGGQIVYASAEHLYVAAPAWVDEPRPLDDDGDPARPDDDATAAGDEPGTDIHRFDLTSADRATYEMSGHVDGQLLNQFAMDEHEGRLRVATTTGSPTAEGEGESESHVVVLAPGDGQLTEVGRVSGLGRGESVHSVRFLGDVGYVVTFERTDPLYTIDLSRPESPEVTGELEILGYSAYLHPVADGYLLGVGQDATAEGATLGTQVALFDVRDPAAPTRVAQATLPGASSDAEWDHRAFLWWGEDGLAAIPVASYDETPFTGLVGFDVEVEGREIAERGRVAHPGQQGGGPVPVPLPRPIEPGAGNSGGSDEIVAPEPVEYVPPITRSLVIGDRLWTLSAAGLASSDLATLDSTDFVGFG